MKVFNMKNGIILEISNFKKKKLIKILNYLEIKQHIFK